jgi:hypothetical protein
LTRVISRCLPGRRATPGPGVRRARPAADLADGWSREQRDSRRARGSARSIRARAQPPAERFAARGAAQSYAGALEQPVKK